MIRWLNHLAFACLALFCADAAAQDVTRFQELTTLRPEQAASGRPIRIQGIVLGYDAGWDQLYVHDGRETGYLHPHDFSGAPESGQLIEITGTTYGDTSMSNLNFTVLGREALPTAKKVELSALANDHGGWIEITGRVLSAEGSRGRLALLVSDQRLNCLVWVLGSPVPADFSRFLDARVRIRGINASKITDGRLESPVLFALGLNEVTIVEPAAAKPSQLPVVSIGGLLNRELGSWTQSRIRINGLVVSFQPGQSLIVKDPTGVIRAQVIQQTEMRSDERVDVWGFLEVSENETFLNHAYFEVVRATPREIAVSPARGTNVRSAGLPQLLTQVSDIVKLPREEAAEHIPVRLQGVITYADPEWRNGFLQNGGDAVYVDLDPSLKDVRSGQWVELTGRTSPGGFAPEVLSSTIQVITPTNLPAPVRVDLEDLANGQLDAHWVEMEGVVRRLDPQSGHITLNLRTPKGRFKVIIPNFDNQPLPTQLIDALVSVQGACTSELNVRRQLSGITLHVPGLDYVKILQPAPADPFAIPTTPIEAVATFDPDRMAGRRVKVRGTVTLKIPGQGFIVQDATGGMRVLTRQTNELRSGDFVEALGFPAIGDFSPFLEEAAFRGTGSGPLPGRKITTAEQILLHGTNDSQLVELNARLLQNVPRSANPQLVLQDGPIIFTAHVVSQSRRQEVPALESGSLLRLIGVCSIQGGERHEPETFRVLLRTPGDITLLETPPWWTSTHAFMVAGGMLLAMATALAWVALLRRQVRAQTELIRQKLDDEAALKERFRELFENANDMVYTHDLEGRITSINQTGERLLQRSRDAILSRNILELVADDQHGAARLWLDNVLQGSEVPTVEWDFVAASGQRVKVEISTRRIEQAGQLVEVEGIARDITERKRLEREILEISNREQRRIGHDLHDGVCQQLAGISFLTSTLADKLEEKGVPESSQAERISTLVHGVINQIRGVARGLFPVRLEENGLASALEELAANASELFKINCRFISEDPPSVVENTVALHLYYIVLEAVANASKHGKARNVTITLEPSGGRYLLNVHDDGVGLATPSGPQTGMGLRIMHYRARVIGAALTLQSRPNSGTDVTCLFQPVSGELPKTGEPIPEPASPEKASTR